MKANFFMFLLVALVLVSCSSCKKDPDPTPTVDKNSVIAVVNYNNATGAISVSLTVAQTAGLTNASCGLCLGKSLNPDVNTALQNLGTIAQDFSKKSYTTTLDLDPIDNSLDYHVRAYIKIGNTITYGDDIIVKTWGLTDVEGNTYHTKKIGTLTWTTENFKCTKYNDGTAIPNITDNAAWRASQTGAYCDYGNDPANGTRYGHFYNNYVIAKIAPAGWHVPTADECALLRTVVGGASEGRAIKDNGSYGFNSSSFPATNSSGFSLLASGYRGAGSDPVNFGDLGLGAAFWSSTVLGSSAYCTYVLNTDNNLYANAAYPRQTGYNIRLIKDY